MSYEIDFLNVGEESKSGDAICLRFKDSAQRWVTGVIDGGSKDSGEKLCDHIEKYYGTKEIDFVLNTHPDADHTSGLISVLEKLIVKKLYMHLPWTHINDITPFLTDKRVTKESLLKRMKDNIGYAYELFELAQKKKIPIEEPFQNVNIHPNFIILGPRKEFYLEQLINFRAITDYTEDTTGTIFGKAKEILESTANWVTENFLTDSLGEPADDATSGENNSSVIALLSIDDRKSLFTGDAGVPALKDALWDKSISLNFFQVPHHGSRRNLGPNILNHLFGKPATYERTKATAFISAAKKGEPKHPSKKVINALIRRGLKVYKTQGVQIHHFSGNISNRGWGPASPVAFYERVEGDSE